MAVRIDKFLWAVRIYKTRTVAADAVKMNRVAVGGAWVKASYDVRVGDVLDVRKGQVTFRFRVLELVGNRQPAKNVPLYIENITPQEELDKLTVPRETIFITRDRGTGRPTKKERRDIDALMEEFFLEDLDD
jgi:ribosome-associated heat shock protein Hsp15